MALSDEQMMLAYREAAFGNGAARDRTLIALRAVERAVREDVLRELSARCQNHPAVASQLCQACLDHAMETGAIL